MPSRKQPSKKSSKPRTYTPVERQKAVDAGRDRILTAARELLEGDHTEAFSLDAVARRAGVSRMTVYNQFESKAGLLEALFDVLAVSGGFGNMAAVFREQDPAVALDELVALLGRFWTFSRRAHGRLRAAALADADLASAITQRNERRRTGVAELVRRLQSQAKPIVPRDEVVNVLFVLLGFDTFDAFAGPERTPDQVVPMVQRLARGVLGLPSTGRPRATKR
jgi:AcrR family transcriptional regulator